MWRFISSFSVALKNLKAACSTPSFSVTPDSLFNTCWAKTNANYERIEAIRSKSRPHSANRLCSGRSIHVINDGNVSVQQFKTRPPERVNLRKMSYIHNMFFCSGRSSTLEMHALKPPRRVVYHVVDVGCLTSNSSIQDASILSRQACHGTRLQV